MLKRVLGVAGGVAAAMAAAACAVVALCFTIYTLLLMIVPPAGAGAIVFAVAALIAATAAFVALKSASLPKVKPAPKNLPPPTLAEQAMDVVRGHPLAVAGAALAAGVAAFANPALVTAVLRAFTAPPRNRR